MSTLILSREAIAQLMTRADYVDAVEQAFARLAGGRVSVPPVVHIGTPDGAFHIKSAAFVGEPHYVAVKVNGNFPDNNKRHGLPTIQGAIVLCDARNGALLAVMDSSEVTAMRTGAATAVAAKYLADPGSRIATIIGCGIQGRVQLQFLTQVLTLQKVFAFDISEDRRMSFAREMSLQTGLKIMPADRFDDCTRQSQVIVTCTSSRSAYLQAAHVAQGAFIAAIGADNHDKQELDPHLMRKAKVVVDILDQCAESGDLHHALAAGVMTRSDVSAELGDVVAGNLKVRTTAEDIVVFDSTGAAIQDVAAAGVVYERAKGRGLGLALDLS